MTGPKLALQPTPEEPWLTLDRVGKPVEFLIITSATYWVLNMRSSKLSNKSFKIMRVSGKEIFFWVTGANCAKLLQSCPPLCDPMDYSPPDSSVEGIFQPRILEWVSMLSSRGSSWLQGSNSHLFISHALAGRYFTTSGTWEAHMYVLEILKKENKICVAIDKSIYIHQNSNSIGQNRERML